MRALLIGVELRVFKGRSAAEHVCGVFSALQERVRALVDLREGVTMTETLATLTRNH